MNRPTKLFWPIFVLSVTAIALLLPAAGQDDDVPTFSGAMERTVPPDANGNASSSQEVSLPRMNYTVTGANVRTVFHGLAKTSGVDIVLSEQVSGKVSLNVTNKTWQEIVSIICKIQNLKAIKESGYIYIVSNTEYTQQQLDAASAQSVEDKTSPLIREIIPLSNISAAEIITTVQPLLSERGKITTSEHNNALIIFETQENLKEIKKTIYKLDIETVQIAISCKIIEVSSGETENLGVHWGFINSEAGVEGAHLSSDNIVAGALERVSYGILTPERFSVALEYLFSENKGEVVAQPSITTLDNKEAKIFMGQQIPLVTLDEAGNNVVTYVDAGTELTVTPHVTGEGRILLSLSPKKKSYTLDAALPIINEQSAETNVVVSDGETVVIAGLTSNEEQNVEGGIPLLKDIPLIGNIFKRSEKRKVNKDLIIFVTPHIIQRTLENTTQSAVQP